MDDGAQYMRTFVHLTMKIYKQNAKQTEKANPKRNFCSIQNIELSERNKTIIRKIFIKFEEKYLYISFSTASK